MKMEKIGGIVNGKFINEYKNGKINKIKIDTRKLKKNDCYIALIGKNLDGHDFIEEAIKKKVSLIIVSKDIKIKTNIPILKVKDTHTALIQISKYYKEKYKIPYIAITGSNGKTTTKELISTILSKKYNVLKTEKNYNNNIGIPLTLLNLNEKHEIGIIEMGMNHKGEIEELSKLIKPDIGIITNIGTSHLEYLKNKKNIFKAKMEVTSGIEDGILIVNGNDKYLKKIKNNLKYDVIKTGVKSNYNLVPYGINQTIHGLKFKLKHMEKEYTIKTDLIGKHLIVDIMLAVETAILFDFKMEEIIESLSNHKSIEKRMNIKEKEKFIIVDDCYNANLESYMGLINLLKEQKKKKIIIAGDILELGKYNKKIHKKVIKNLKKIKNADLYLVGSNMEIGKNKVMHFSSNEKLKTYLKTLGIEYFKDTVIALKASRGIHLENVKEMIENL
jgi:UDP-N-acetylmuramoyl-tripeptide--D-alanyl-D-alanine ligase